VTDRPMSFGRGDQSVSDVEVVLTDRISEVSGVVSDDAGHAVPRAAVVLFSTDRDQWFAAPRFLRRTAADATGTFAIAGVPLGAYHLVALTDLTAGDDWQDPTILESLIRRAVRVAVGDAQKQAVQLRVTKP